MNERMIAKIRIGGDDAENATATCLFGDMIGQARGLALKHHLPQVRACCRGAAGSRFIPAGPVPPPVAAANGTDLPPDDDCSNDLRGTCRPTCCIGEPVCATKPSVIDMPKP